MAQPYQNSGNVRPPNKPKSNSNPSKATMAEYWKSTPNYWCKHCKTYIRDTAFERNQHEATGKHQGNLKRFLRDIHRSKEKEEKEGQRAKNEVERLKGLVSTPTSTPGSEAASGSAERQQQPPWKRDGASGTTSRSVGAQERKKQMAQLVEMGVAIPEEFRPEMALAGEWRTTEGESNTKDSGTGSAVKTASATAVGVRKRKHQGETADVEEARPRKAWGSAIRRHPGAEGEVDDELEALLGQTSELRDRKVEKTEPKTEVDDDAAVKRETDQADVEHEDEVKGSDNLAADSAAERVKKETGETEDVKSEKEDMTETTLHSVPDATTADTPADGPPVVFKKRKPKQMKR